MAKSFFNGINLQNQRITNLASPSASTDATNKQYVDNLVNGLDWKESVEAATTTNGTLATAFEADQVIDGYTLVAGDRILLKNQSDAEENGIYTVEVTGAPSRAADGLTGELTSNATVRVNQGTVNGDTAWTLTTNDPITVGTTEQTWVRSDAGTPYDAGAGLALSSGTFSVVAGSGIIADGSSTRIDPSVVSRHYATAIGNGSDTTITVTHNLGTRDVTVTLYAASGSYEEAETDIAHATTNTVTLTFASAPASGAWRVVVMG